MQFGAIEFTRRQRERVARETAGMSGEEKAAYFQKGARRLKVEIEKRRAELAGQQGQGTGRKVSKGEASSGRTSKGKA